MKQFVPLLAITALFILTLSAFIDVGSVLATSRADRIVTVQNFAFLPQHVTINPGESVTWNNGGGFHNVVADDGSFRCANGCDGAGGNGNASSASWSATFSFDTPGTYNYYCQIHGGANGSGMAGSVTVETPTAVGIADIAAEGAAWWPLLLVSLLVTSSLFVTRRGEF